MVYIFNFLKNYRGRIAWLIGDLSLSKLCIFIDGYEFALFELHGVKPGFNVKFLRFIETHEGLTPNVGTRWPDILLKNRSKEEALELFYSYLQKFEQSVAQGTE